MRAEAGSLSAAAKGTRGGRARGLSRQSPSARVWRRSRRRRVGLNRRALASPAA